MSFDDDALAQRACVLIRAAGCVALASMWNTWPGIVRAEDNHVQELAVNHELPLDVTQVLNDSGVRRFAWQTFIALNWPADGFTCGKPDTNRRLGAPGPVVWQTYKRAYEVFRAGADPPAPWGQSRELLKDLVPLQALCTTLQSIAMIGAIPVTYDTLTSRPIAKISEWRQATNPYGSPWLTDQDGNLIWYETLLNEDLFNYISENELYDAGKQQAVMQSGGNGISLPAGPTRYGVHGAIQVKAAWRRLPSDDSLDSRYFTTKALILRDPLAGPANGFEKVKLGLVGLHVVRKTTNAPQLIWATFEHVDCCPDYNTIDRTKEYIFFRHETTEPANVVPVASQSRSKPSQVVRDVPLPVSIRDINETAWNAIREEVGEALWMNYQLVDAQWPQTKTAVRSRTKTPLPHGNPRPALLCNTTMETYVQRAQSCVECHRHASIAPTASSPNPRFGSDYSFLFRKAHELKTTN